MRKLLLAMMLNLFAAACLQAQSDLPFDVEPVTSFDEPWAIAFLPDGRMLVTANEGALFQDGPISTVTRLHALRA